MGSSLTQLLSSNRRPYSIVELRAAATLPDVQAVLQTIIRDILSSDFTVAKVDDSVTDEHRDEFVAMLRRPVSGEDWETYWAKHLYNLLTVGKADAELLRANYQSAVARAYVEGRIDGGRMVEMLRKAEAKTRGPIRGFCYYDPANIQSRRLANGTYDDPAFVNASADVVSVAAMGQVATWDEYDFVEQLWMPAVESDRFGQGVSPVEQAYPLIDLLYYYLYFVKDRMEHPTIDKLISLYAGASGRELDDPQIRAITDQLQEDVAQGRTPIVRGLEAKVFNLAGARPETENIALRDKFQLVLWQIVGAGFLEMGREAESGQTAEEYAAISRKQATGVVRRYIQSFIRRIVEDPWSDWGGMVFDWKITEEKWTKKDLWRIAYPVALTSGVLTPKRVQEMEFPAVYAKEEAAKGEAARVPAEAPVEEAPTVQQPAEQPQEQPGPVKVAQPTGRKSAEPDYVEKAMTELPEWAVEIVKRNRDALDEWSSGASLKVEIMEDDGQI